MFDPLRYYDPTRIATIQTILTDEPSVAGTVYEMADIINKSDSDKLGDGTVSKERFLEFLQGEYAGAFPWRDLVSNAQADQTSNQAKLVKEIEMYYRSEIINIMPDHSAGLWLNNVVALTSLSGQDVQNLRDEAQSPGTIAQKYGLASNVQPVEVDVAEQGANALCGGETAPVPEDGWYVFVLEVPSDPPDPDRESWGNTTIQCFRNDSTGDNRNMVVSTPQVYRLPQQFRLLAGEFMTWVSAHTPLNATARLEKV